MVLGGGRDATEKGKETAKCSSKKAAVWSWEGADMQEKRGKKLPSAPQKKLQVPCTRRSFTAIAFMSDTPALAFPEKEAKNAGQRGSTCARTHVRRTCRDLQNVSNNHKW